MSSDSGPHIHTGYTGYLPLTVSSEPPNVRTGYIILISSFVFLLIGSYATLFSVYLPSSGWVLLDVLSEDVHYKYFVVLLIPTTAYFVIANWVGWQYYRNS